MDKQDKFNFGYQGGDSPYYDPDVQAGKRERYWHDELRKMGNRQTTSAGAPVSSPPSRIESPAEAAKAGAAADPTAGVDGALFRSSYDNGGLFGIEGARLMPKRDLSLKLLVGYGQAPLKLAVPGIGDASKDKVLDYLVTLDMAFGMTLSDRVAIGIDAAAYRTTTGVGYGVRG